MISDYLTISGKKIKCLVKGTSQVLKLLRHMKANETFTAWALIKTAHSWIKKKRYSKCLLKSSKSLKNKTNLTVAEEISRQFCWT